MTKQLAQLFILVIIFCSCKRNIDSHPERLEVKIERVTFEYDYNFDDVLSFNNNYLFRNSCSIDDSCELILTDKKINVNQKITKYLNEKRFQLRSIWVHKDTVFGNCYTRINDKTIGHTIYYFTLREHCWKQLYAGTIQKKYYSSFNFDLDIPFYEDKHYRIRTISDGEFGGATYFFNKKTNKIFSCPTSDVKSIHKIQNIYYILSSLPHMSGSTQLISIENPEKLFHIKSMQNIDLAAWHWNEEDLKKVPNCDQGVTTLIDTSEILTSASFVKNNTIYCIYSDLKKTYLGYVSHNKIVKIKEVLNKITYYGNTRNIKSNPSLFPFKAQRNRGFFEISNSKIRIVTLK